MSYNSEPISHFQKIIRRGSMELVDHMTRPLTPLEKARVELIPPGGDWRDLPNMERKLEDGTVAKKLLYRYKDFNQGKHIFIFIFFLHFQECQAPGPCVGCAPAWRGRAHRATPRPSRRTPSSPGSSPTAGSSSHSPPAWCPSQRNHQYAGLYGRLENDGWFSTTTTEPRVSGKQGRVVHPEHHRVLTLRESARTQGFPDSFLFSGGLADKYKQVGA